MEIRCAERINKIPPYLFARIDKAIARKKAEGEEVINLGIGDPDLPTPRHIVQAMQRYVEDESTHRYPSYEGMAEFREAVAKWYKRRFGVKLNPENEVIALIGSKEGIAHLPLALLNPEELAIVPNPAYPVYRMGTILAGGEPIDLPLTKEKNFLPDLWSIEKNIARKAKLMFLNYPNNPTTATASKSFFKEVVDFAEENEIIVAHDAPYSELTFDGYRAPSFLEIKGAKEVGVEFHSLSKTYNMTGWRIGMAVGNKEVLKALGKVKQNVDSGVFNAVQKAAIVAMEGSQKEFRKNLKIWKERRDFMVDGLQKLGFDVEKPKATFYLWIPLPEGEKDSISFAEKILEKTGVVFTPGVGFGSWGEGYIRLALTHELERLEEALNRLKKVMS